MSNHLGQEDQASRPCQPILNLHTSSLSNGMDSAFHIRGGGSSENVVLTRSELDKAELLHHIKASQPEYFTHELLSLQTGINIPKCSSYLLLFHFWIQMVSYE